jgi:hypothetical protein
MTQTQSTQKERLASLEAYVDGHAREHALAERVWTVQLDAIEARLARIERLLLEANANGNDGGNGRLRLARRDLGLAGLTAALTSALWWLSAALRTAAGGA